MDYFDSTYFDPDYFDTDSATPPTPTPPSGGGTGIRGRRRRVLPVQLPEPRDTEDWTVLIL